MKMDICGREAVYGLFEEEHPDVVVNFATESHVNRTIANPVQKLLFENEMGGGDGMTLTKIYYAMPVLYEEIYEARLSCTFYLSTWNPHPAVSRIVK